MSDLSRLPSIVQPETTAWRGVAQWLVRFVRDPEVYITVSNDVIRRGVAQWLARFVRDEEAGGSSPLTPTINFS